MQRLGITKGFVEYAAADGRDFVVEGFHLEPRAMMETQRRHPDSIRAVLLVRTDAAQLAASLPHGVDGNDWAVRFTSRPETFSRIAAMVVRYSRILEEEAVASGCPVVDTSSGSLADGVDAAIDVLLG